MNISGVWPRFSRTQTNLSRLSHALSGDENYKYVDISTFQKTHNQELGSNSCLSLLVASWKLFSLLASKANLRAAGGRRGGRVVLL